MGPSPDNTPTLADELLAGWCFLFWSAGGIAKALFCLQKGWNRANLHGVALLVSLSCKRGGNLVVQDDERLSISGLAIPRYYVVLACGCVRVYAVCLPVALLIR